MGMSVRRKCRYNQECGNEGAVMKQLEYGILEWRLINQQLYESRNATCCDITAGILECGNLRDAREHISFESVSLTMFVSKQ